MSFFTSGRIKIEDCPAAKSLDFIMAPSPILRGNANHHPKTEWWFYVF